MTDTLIVNEDSLPPITIRFYVGADGRLYPSRATAPLHNNISLPYLMRHFPPEQGRFWDIVNSFTAVVKVFGKP